MIMDNDRRLIEEMFPIKEVSDNAINERNNRKGKIGDLHPWWARRPTTVSRATIFSALIKLLFSSIIVGL